MTRDIGIVRYTGRRLRVGMKVRDLDGTVYLVTLVNDCRARLEPINKTRKVTIAKRFGEEGETVSFAAKASAINISPNSEIEILKEPKHARRRNRD